MQNESNVYLDTPSWMKDKDVSILKNNQGWYFTVLTKETISIILSTVKFALLHSASFKRFIKNNPLSFDMEQLIDEFNLSLSDLNEKVKNYGYIN